MTPSSLKTIKLDSAKIQKHFPNLIQGENFEYTSQHTDEYNCVAWATEITNKWIQFIYDEHGNYDINAVRYIRYFSELGFVETENIAVENAVKIAIYADSDNNFTHVARQLRSGKWTSKIGDWEDIEHRDLQDIAGGAYGKPIILMVKK